MMRVDSLGFNATNTVRDAVIVPWEGGRMEDRPDLEDLTLMQWTGLLDKNGKEIYEGDIIKSSYGVNEVFWNEDEATFDVPAGTFFYRAARVCEVLGNIYENPTLMSLSSV